MSDVSPPVLIIGHPEHRRVTGFQQALRSVTGTVAEVLPWRELVLAGKDLRDHLRSGQLLRIETPGENPIVEAELITRGASLTDQVPPTGPLPERIAAGEIVAPHLWYLGFRSFLDDWAALLNDEGSEQRLRVLNHPNEIALLFDKVACQEHLEAAGVPVPPRLPNFRSYDELRERMTATGWARVFVKLRYGSSASGVVALQRNGPHIRAVTSTRMLQDGGELRLVNSLRLSRYTNEREVATLIDALCRFDVYAERWVPKGTYNDAAFDLRMVTIAGEPRHRVLRLSREPMTNLHLGNRRGSFDNWSRTRPAAEVRTLEETCRSVAACFPRCLTLGIDLAITPRRGTPVVFEVNAFGDLLPNLEHDGETVYEAIARALTK